uniref:CRIB domain-containing protein n=1 Tax=Oryza barthii TaxID=65489 RepID=A0A0D3GJZ1_9ORYZ
MASVLRLAVPPPRSPPCPRVLPATSGARRCGGLKLVQILCEELRGDSRASGTSPMEIKMKGIFKGLKIISQIFALQKQHEMEIGCPTDVRHVSHIGVGTNFDKPPRATLPTEICTDKSGQEAAACCHDIPRGPKNPRRKKAARASSASSFLSRSRSSSFVTACGDFSELRGGLRVA